MAVREIEKGNVKVETVIGGTGIGGGGAPRGAEAGAETGKTVRAQTAERDMPVQA